MPRLVNGLEQIFTDLGIVGDGYKLFFFEYDTTTPKDTYSNPELSIANPNPVECDASGRPESDIWGQDPSTYKMILATPDSVLGNIDPVVTLNPIDDTNTGSIINITPLPTCYWGSTTGTSTNYLINPALVPITSYSNVQCFFMDVHVICAASPTLNVNNLGQVSLKKYTNAGTKVALIAGDLQVARYLCINDGVDVVVLNPQYPYLNGNTITQSASKVTISNNVSDSNNDIDFSAGSFLFSDGTGFAALTAITKRLDAAWAAGTNQGGLDTGAKANSTWYYCYAIFNPTTQTADAIFTATFGSPTLPSGYTKSTYVGAIRTDGSSNLYGFTQRGDTFTFTTSKRDLNAVATTGGTETSFTVTAPINCMAFGSGFLTTTQAGTLVLKVYSPAMTMTSLTANDGQFSAANGQYNGSSSWQAVTNSSSQLKRNCTTTTANEQFFLFTDGWVDLNLS